MDNSFLYQVLHDKEELVISYYDKTFDVSKINELSEDEQTAIIKNLKKADSPSVVDEHAYGKDTKILNEDEVVVTTDVDTPLRVFLHFVSDNSRTIDEHVLIVNVVELDTGLQLQNAYVLNLLESASENKPHQTLKQLDNWDEYSQDSYAFKTLAINDVCIESSYERTRGKGLSFKRFSKECRELDKYAESKNGTLKYFLESICNKFMPLAFIFCVAIYGVMFVLTQIIKLLIHTTDIEHASNVVQMIVVLGIVGGTYLVLAKPIIISAKYIKKLFVIEGRDDLIQKYYTSYAKTHVTSIRELTNKLNQIIIFKSNPYQAYRLHEFLDVTRSTKQTLFFDFKDKGQVETVIENEASEDLKPYEQKAVDYVKSQHLNDENVLHRLTIIETRVDTMKEYHDEQERKKYGQLFSDNLVYEKSVYRQSLLKAQQEYQKQQTELNNDFKELEKEHDDLSQQYNDVKE